MRQGEPTVFVRLAGCDRRCSFCDTKYAWTGGQERSVPEVLEEVRRVRSRFPARWVCLTGGEPFMQDTRRLVKRLKQDGYRVQVETNGTRYYRLAADWLSVSPKPPDFFVRSQFQRTANEVKLVVTRDLTAAVIAKMRTSFPARVPIILQPQSNRRWSQKRALHLIKESARSGLDNIRVSLQLHKVLGIR